MKVKTYNELPTEIKNALRDYLSDQSVAINGEYNQQLSFKAILPAISKQANKRDDISTEEKRTIAILDKLSKSFSIEHGSALLGIYLNTYCHRGKEIHSNIDESKSAEPDFKDAVPNISYNLDLLDIGGKCLPATGISSRCVISRENKLRDNEPAVACTHCNSVGKVKCASCEGSGQEQYIDGNYASGEERVKTGMCSQCQGQGTVECPECNGSGVLEIFASNYAVVKSVDELYSQATEAILVYPWNAEDYEDVVAFECSNSTFDQLCQQREYGRGDSDSEGDLASMLQQIIYNEESIRLLKRNKNETLIDNTSAATDQLKTIDPELVKTFIKGRKYSEAKFKGLKRGDTVAEMEQYYIIPITRLRMALKSDYGSDENYDWYLLPMQKNKIDVIMSSVPDTGLLKYLYYKLVK